MVDESLGELAATLGAPKSQHRNMIPQVEAGRILALVSHAGLASSTFDPGDVDIMGGAKALGVGAETDLIVIQGELLARGDPRRSESTVSRLRGRDGRRSATV